MTENPTPVPQLPRSCSGKLLAAILEDVRGQIRPAISAAFHTADSILNPPAGSDPDGRPQRIREIESDLSRHIGNAFRGAAARIKVDLPEIQTLLKGARIELADGGVEWCAPRLKGQGQQRSLYLALVLTLAEERRRSQSSSLCRPFILLVEEPEAFLHPSAHAVIRGALETISATDQVLFSTHSPTMVSPQHLSEVTILKRQSASGPRPETKRLKPIGSALGGQDKRMRMLFEYGRSSKFLFSDCALVVEGPSDIVLFDAISECLYKARLADHGWACVDSGNKSTVRPCMSILEGIGLQVAGIVDLDFLWDGAGSVLGADSALSQFGERFKTACIENGLQAADGRLRGDKKKEAFRLLRQDFAAEAAALRATLRADHRIWVLAEGEIEDYVGLAACRKGDYVDAAATIASGERTPLHAEERRELINWLDSTGPSSANQRAPSQSV